jgi:hypothetical protein
MYTRHRDALARLRAYHRELTAQYHAAIARRQWARARALYTLRHRVWVAVRWHEEWAGAPPALPSGQPVLEAPALG